MRIRVVKTASKAIAVQVVQYSDNKRKILQHLGSAHTEQELEELKAMAQEWIKVFSTQPSLFAEDKPNQLLHLNHCQFIGVKYRFYYEHLLKILSIIGLDKIPQILKDLVAIRIFEPASKLRSLELLEQYFDVVHLRKNYYKIAPDYIKIKDVVEKAIVEFAQQAYTFNYDLLFYDVTTLYFETFEEDELRKNGFSKDNKSQQPQILIGLMVSKDGFPIAYEIFSGNTFEGHTIIPVVKRFIEKNKVKEFTVVADAAMISSKNVIELIKNGINYIVGARLGNISENLLEGINKKLEREDGKCIRIKTDNGYLICNYSSVRYRKDLYEMNKQIEKAKQVIQYPSKSKKLKFTQVDGQKIGLNEALIEKTKKWLGIKGYYTNIEEEKVSNQMILARYHELYKIEQAFRISKSDLQTRPIFHYKEDPIKLHILICFVALVISKHIELKTNISIRKFIDEAKKATDGIILNQITQKPVVIKARTSEKMNDLIAKIFSPH